MEVADLAGRAVPEVEDVEEDATLVNVDYRLRLQTITAASASL